MLLISSLPHIFMLKCANFPFLHDIYYTTTRNVRELQHRLCNYFCLSYYTTTRNVRELQLENLGPLDEIDYTTTRNVRELQPSVSAPSTQSNYTTTRNVRELQLHVQHFCSITIIPQQETSGNYNDLLNILAAACIIPQQETSGNYNSDCH